jgi:hypothetical protein
MNLRALYNVTNLFSKYELLPFPRRTLLLGVSLLVKCSSFCTIALMCTNRFRRFQGTLISVKVNTGHVPPVNKSFRYDAVS